MGEHAKELRVDVESGEIVVYVRTDARTVRLVLPAGEARKLALVLLASSQQVERPQ
jgi:hypothetical protein